MKTIHVEKKHKKMDKWINYIFLFVLLLTLKLTKNLSFCVPAEKKTQYRINLYSIQYDLNVFQLQNIRMGTN